MKLLYLYQKKKKKKSGKVKIKAGRKEEKKKIKKDREMGDNLDNLGEKFIDINISHLIVIL